HAIKYTDISIKEEPDTSLLNCDIKLTSYKPSTISFKPEGTNTSGDIGAAATLAYENRNLFRGSEALSIELRGAYEHIKSLEGYSGHHYWEYGAEAKLSFPHVILPFIKQKVSEMKNAPIIAASDISISYNLQDRPEFNRRVFSGGWRYRWARPNGKTNYRLDILNLDFVQMPWISDTFRKEYLEDETSKNAILKYNYQDLFIMNIGFGVSYNNGVDAFKVNFESAGNLQQLVSSVTSAKVNADGQYKSFGIAFAQYAKADIDFTHSFFFDKNNSIVLHGGLGLAYPYGNSSILPFEKRYFSGGANSVRGWSVRSLGPGGYKGQDGRINFINQTGDMRLDLNAEWRTYLFWKFNGAIFVDAGNIWTLREYKDQPDGQFRFSTFLSQIAASYGLGLRLNFDYFILRFDMAMKAVNPVHETSREHYPIIHPDLSRDFTFHFAVGLPF
ncbi:MAG: BamA/TamA family outer membrane protein, partial [Prevotellaceae bacterium]|nr:BamA/TamA family outer membrane protein [Prevotellaceae bacterium]